MRIVSVYDLSARDSLLALKRMRQQIISRRTEEPLEQTRIESDSVFRQIYEIVGGRTSYLARIARSGDMLGELTLVDSSSGEAQTLLQMEKAWLQSKYVVSCQIAQLLICRIGLIPEHDDDVM
jgi:hypothetical protein